MLYDLCANRIRQTMPREQAARLVARYVVQKPRIKAMVDAYVREHWGDAMVLGIHYRGTDKSAEAPRVPFDEVEAVVRNAISRAGPRPSKLFVATDEQAFLDYMRDRFPAPLLYREMFRSTDGRAIDVVNADGNHQKGEDAVLDCLLLSRTRPDSNRVQPQPVRGAVQSAPAGDTLEPGTMSRLRSIYFIVANTAILLLLASLGTDVAIRIYQRVTPSLSRRQLTDAARSSYAHMAPADVDELLRAAGAMHFHYVPLLGFVEGAITSRFLNIDEHGIRSNGQTERDITAMQDAIWFLGGSTALGFGIADRETIPAQLEAIVGRPVMNLGVRATPPRWRTIC